MKIEISSYFKQTFDKAYIVENKGTGRKDVHLISNKGYRKCMSYAKYVWISYNEKEVPEGFEVDHINNDKTDDRIENLQLLSKHDNNIKCRLLHPARITKCICPVCGKEFDFPTRNLNTHPNPCCSRTCGGRKSHFFNSANCIKIGNRYININKIL